MKKTIAFLLIFAPFILFAQFKKDDQDPANVSRVVIWDIAKTDSLDYADGVRPVLAYTYPGKSVLVLAKQAEYEQIKAMFSDSARPVFSDPTVLVGYDFGVLYLPKFSLLKKKDIKKLPAREQMNAQALNEKEKYTLLGQNPLPVYGRRVIEKNGDMKIVFLTLEEQRALRKKDLFDQQL